MSNSHAGGNGSPLKFCSCRMCRYGRKHYGNPARITKVKRAFRRKTKQALKNGIEPQISISVPYTD